MRDTSSPPPASPRSPPISSAPPRVLECPIQLEAVLETTHDFGHRPDKPCGAYAFELRIIRAHVDQSLIAPGKENHIDPDLWRPLMMSFCHFYGLGDRVHPSTLAEIPESLYRPRSPHGALRWWPASIPRAKQATMPLELNGLCPLLQVYDMPTSLRFYRDTLEFALVSTSPALGPPDDFHWVWLRGHGCQLMLNTAYDTGERPDTPDPARVHAHRDVSLYFHCPSADAAAQTLREKGLTVNDPKTAWYGMRQLYFHDPDGYILCFQHPA